MDSTWVSSILLMGFDTASEELSPDTFGLITFRSFVAGMLLFRNSNNLSSLLFSVRATLGGVLVPEGGRRDLMGTVGPPECRKKLVTSSLRKQLTFHNPTTGFPTKRHLRNECRNSILMTITTQTWLVLLIG